MLDSTTKSSRPDSQSRPRGSLVIIVAVLVGLCIVHGVTIWQQCFFIDEIYELTISSKSVPEILVEPDSMPPCYPLLLKGWLNLFGSDEAARLLSALFGLATVATLWRLARDEVGIQCASAAALLAAVSPFLLFYAQMVRSYSLYVFLLALTLLFFLRARRTDCWHDWTGFFLAAAAGCYTHYYFVLFLAAAGVVLLAERGPYRIGRATLVTFISLAVAVAPLLILVQNDTSYQLTIRNYRPLDLAAFGYTFFSFFSGYSLGPSKPELHDLGAGAAFQQSLPWLLIIGGAAILLGCRGLRALRSRKLILPIGVFALLPILLTGVLGQLLDLTYNVRFVAPCVMPLILLLAAGTAATWNIWSTRVAVAALLIVAATAFYNRHYVGRYQNEDVRAACAYIQANSQNGEPVFVVASYMAEAAHYYLTTGSEVVGLPEPGNGGRPISTAADIEQSLNLMRDKIKDRTHWWLLYSRTFDGDKNGRFIDELMRRGKIEQVFAPAGVRLYRANSIMKTANNG